MGNLDVVMLESPTLGSLTLEQPTMFGALKPDQENELLTFVENTDLASALSRNRRDKPHVSCEPCRVRKVRCSGQASSCDRCTAAGATCKYPTREGRRKKFLSGRKANAPTAYTESSGSSNHPPRGDHRQGRGRDDCQPDSTPGAGDDQVPQISDESLGMFDFDLEFGNDQQHAEDWLSSYKSDMAGDGMIGSASGGFDSPSVFHDINHSHSGDSPESLVHPLAGSEYGVSSPRILQSPPLLPSSGPRNTPRLELPSQLSFLEYWAAPSPPSSTSTKSRGKQPNKDFKHLSSNPGIVDGHAIDDCGCLNLSARLLEELGAKSASSDPAAMDVLLSYFRETIGSCATVINCERCTSASENNMLLAMAGQYMSAICERIVVCYLRMQRSQEQRRCPSLDSRGSGGSRGRGAEDDSGSGFSSGCDDMWFLTYRIGSSYERMQVLRCIISVQIAEFWRLLEKLKARAGTRKGHHLVLLIEAESRTKKARAMLKAGIKPPNERYNIDQ